MSPAVIERLQIIQVYHDTANPALPLFPFIAVE